MKQKLKYLLIILMFGSYCTTQAQDHLHEDKVCEKCLHGQHSVGSPYEINFKKEIPYFASSLGLLGSGLIVKDRFGEDPFTVEELKNLDPSKINSFDRSAIDNNPSTARKFSDYTLISGAFLPLYFLTNHHMRSDFFPLLIMGVEVFSITSTITLNAKYAFNRPRPLAYNTSFSDEQRKDPTSKLSFFSGHTAQTAGFSFFMAKVMVDYHPDMPIGGKIGLWSFAVALPAVTGYLRIKGGKHFTSDVITGFALGATMGWLVPQLHKKRDSKLSLKLYNNQGANGLSLTMKLD